MRFRVIDKTTCKEVDENKYHIEIRDKLNGICYKLDKLNYFGEVTSIHDDGLGTMSVCYFREDRECDSE